MAYHAELKPGLESKPGRPRCPSTCPHTVAIQCYPFPQAGLPGRPRGPALPAAVGRERRRRRAPQVRAAGRQAGPQRTRHDREDLLNQLRVEGLVELRGNPAANKHHQQLMQQVEACGGRGPATRLKGEVVAGGANAVHRGCRGLDARHRRQTRTRQAAPCSRRAGACSSGAGEVRASHAQAGRQGRRRRGGLAGACKAARQAKQAKQAQRVRRLPAGVGSRNTEAPRLGR